MKVKEIPVSLFYQTILTITSLKKFLANKKRIPVIVSLTSIPSRFKIIHISVRSILNQSVLPEKIILWVNEDLKDNIPESLIKLQGDIFEIQFSELDCPHLKLVESLRKYPQKIIVTSDDDLIYRKNWLKYLYKEHLDHPKAIISNQSRIITYDVNGQLRPYKEWFTNYDSNIKTNLLLPIGSAGALYPPESLSDNVLDQELFLKLAPKADDLWFKAMSLLKQTSSLQASRLSGEPIPILGSQKVSLKKTNIGQDKNRLQWLALTDYFHLKF